MVFLKQHDYLGGKAHFATVSFFMEEIMKGYNKHFTHRTIRSEWRKLLFPIMIFGMILLMSGCGKKEEFSETEEFMESQEVFTFSPNETFIVENPEEENIADMMQTVASGVMVQLRTGNQLGSGVILYIDQESMLIATAGHVVENSEQVEILFTDGNVAQCMDISVSTNADVGYLRLASTLLEKDTLQACRYAAVDKKSYDTIEAGDGIIVMGCVDGVAANAYEGEVIEPWIYIEDFGQYMILGKTYATPGMSGGGVFDQQGHLIGILCGESEGTEDGDYGEIAILPLTILFSEAGRPLVS